MDSQSIPNRTLRAPSRSCSAYLSYRHQFLSNRPKNWAPNTSWAYLYNSDEFFVIWMIYLAFGWVLSGRLGFGWVSAGFWLGFGTNPAETQPGRWVAGWAARDFEKVFQNITSSLKCSRIARDNVYMLYDVTNAVWVIWPWGPYKMDCELLL